MRGVEFLPSTLKARLENFLGALSFSLGIFFRVDCYILAILPPMLKACLEKFHSKSKQAPGMVGCHNESGLEAEC